MNSDSVRTSTNQLANVMSASKIGALAVKLSLNENCSTIFLACIRCSCIKAEANDVFLKLVVGNKFYHGVLHCSTLAVVDLRYAQQSSLFIFMSVSHVESEMFVADMCPRVLNFSRFFTVD